MNPLWCNGQWLDAVDFPLAPTDRGLLLGLGLFETILCLDGQPVFAACHLARLHDACQRLGWPAPHPDLRETMCELIERNGLTIGRARIRLALSAGSGNLRDLAPGADHLLWMTATHAAPASATVALNLSPWLRNERSPLAGLKCASYAENLLALADAARLGFEETLFANTRGHLCEAATANVFLVKNGRLLTPPLASGCLPGVTRACVLELARAQGIPCDQPDLTENDMLTADEAFLTSSLRGPTAVSRFAARTMPTGPLTDALRHAWQAATRAKVRP